jgi:NAD(P)-dependent dehydrogenase (short-subunit alcohol dehydrogenase family)
LRTYNTHFGHLLDRWADARLDEPTTAELDDMACVIAANARVNKASRGGRSAVEHFVAAVRCIYRYAEDNGWIHPVDNPARKLSKPVRRASHRYAIPPDQLAEICHVAATTGNDPDLDTLILRLHTETACRRSGALALRPHDLDTEQCLVYIPGLAAYSATKGGVMAWTRTIAAEWGPLGIRANSVVPAIRTPMTTSGATERSDLYSSVPLGGALGDPERDFAPVMIFLASDGAGFITGQALAVNGGLGMVR